LQKFTYVNGIWQAAKAVEYSSQDDMRQQLMYFLPQRSKAD